MYVCVFVQLTQFDVGLDMGWIYRMMVDSVSTFCLAPLGLHCVAELLLIMSSRHIHTEA